MDTDKVITEEDADDNVYVSDGNVSDDGKEDADDDADIDD